MYVFNDTIIYISKFVEANAYAQYFQHGNKIEFIRFIPLHVKGKTTHVIPIDLNRFLVLQSSSWVRYNPDSVVYIYDALKNTKMFFEPADLLTRNMFAWKHNDAGVCFKPGGFSHLSVEAGNPVFMAPVTYIEFCGVGYEKIRDDNLPIMALIDIDKRTFTLANLRAPYPAKVDGMYSLQSECPMLSNGHNNAGIISFWWTPEVIRVDLKENSAKQLISISPESKSPSQYPMIKYSLRIISRMICRN